MDTDLLKVILTVGVLMLIFEVGIITWDTQGDATRRGPDWSPSTSQMVFEWTVYMSVFVLGLLLLDRLLIVACSICR
jgi:hypothetical protein